VAFFAFKIDDQLLRGFIVAFDFAEAPAPMDDIGVRLHGFEFGFG